MIPVGPVSPMTPNQPTRSAAHGYAQRGLRVFPLHGIGPDGRCTCGDHGGPNCSPGKHPATGGRGLYEATTDPQQIDAWFDAADRIGAPINIAIAIPDGLVVIDGDVRNGAPPEPPPDLPLTWTTRTGGGGWHCWYTVPPGKKLPSKLREGVDVKQLGGYVVAPPSLHASGNRYRWVTERPPAPAPDWLGPMLTDRSHNATTQIDVDDLDEPALPEAEHARLAALLEPACVTGQMHDLCKNLGGWLKQRGATTGDADEILKLLPLNNHGNGIQAAAAAWGIPKAFGWEELKGLVGEQAAAQLDAAPNPAAERRDAMIDQLVTHLASKGLVRAPEPYAPLDAGDPWFGLGPPAHLDAGGEDDLEPIIEGLDVARGHCTGLIAYANGGKTPLLRQALLSVANGVDFLGHKTHRGRCALFVFEKWKNGRRKQRSLAAAMGVDPNSVDVFELRDRQLTPQVIASIHAVIQTREYVLCGIDTYNSGVDAAVDHNSSEFAVALRQLTSATEAAWLVACHTRKSADGTDLRHIDGHNSVGGAFDACWGLVRRSERDKDKYELTCVREIDEYWKPVRIQASEGRVGDLARCYEVDESKDEREEQPNRRVTEAERMRALEAEIANQLTIHAGKEEPYSDVVKRLRTGWNAGEKRTALKECSQFGSGIITLLNADNLIPWNTARAMNGRRSVVRWASPATAGRIRAVPEVAPRSGPPIQPDRTKFAVVGTPPSFD